MFKITLCNNTWILLLYGSSLNTVCFARSPGKLPPIFHCYWIHICPLKPTLHISFLRSILKSPLFHASSSISMPSVPGTPFYCDIYHTLIKFFMYVLLLGSVFLLEDKTMSYSFCMQSASLCPKPVNIYLKRPGWGECIWNLLWGTLV